MATYGSSPYLPMCNQKTPRSGRQPPSVLNDESRHWAFIVADYYAIAFLPDSWMSGLESAAARQEAAEQIRSVSLVWTAISRAGEEGKRRKKRGASEANVQIPPQRRAAITILLAGSQPCHLHGSTLQCQGSTQGPDWTAAKVLSYLLVHACQSFPGTKAC